MNDYITSGDISWSKCVGICTNGAAALTRHRKGFQAEVRQVSPHVNFIHCVVHKEALLSRDLGSVTCCATRGRKSRELCESSPFEISPIAVLCKE
jgi:hypothetical protein